MKTLKMYLALFICLGFYATINAQEHPTTIRNGESYGTTTINGHVVKILIIDGDTLPVADMESIQVTQKRNFANRDERRRYKKWRKYAAKVYPYAAEAIRLYREVEQATKDMKKNKKRKYGRKKEKELKPQYTKELKNLTKSQGYILIKILIVSVKISSFILCFMSMSVGCDFFVVIRINRK